MPMDCPECGEKTKEKSRFCGECGYKLVITEVVEDEERHIRKAQEIIESESPIDPPKKLTLMPGEKSGFQKLSQSQEKKWQMC